MADHFIFARIVQRFLPALRQQQALSPQQTTACQMILNCHTARLGGLAYACDHCAQPYPRYHSCRNRHCPQCQQAASVRWADDRLQDVLAVPYFHLVFTLPHELNGWAQLHPDVLYHLLFQCAWHTLDDYAQHSKQLQGQLGMTAALHTWGQNLNQHIHVHCLIPGGALDATQQFVSSRRQYLYPQRALANRFRGKMVSALRRAWNEGQLRRLTSAAQVDVVLNTLMHKTWVVDAKTHLHQPETVVRYLARYTHRTAISLSRIQSVNDKTVTFQWRDYRDEQKKVMTLQGDEFLRRFLLHVLPKGFMRLRHYGFLANRVRIKSLQQIRQCLDKASAKMPQQKQPPATNLSHTEDKPERCPQCKIGYLRLIGKLLPEKRRCMALMITA